MDGGFSHICYSFPVSTTNPSFALSSDIQLHSHAMIWTKGGWLHLYNGIIIWISPTAWPLISATNCFILPLPVAHMMTQGILISRIQASRALDQPPDFITPWKRAQKVTFSIPNKKHKVARRCSCFSHLFKIKLLNRAGEFKNMSHQQHSSCYEKQEMHSRSTPLHWEWVNEWISLSRFQSLSLSLFQNRRFLFSPLTMVWCILRWRSVWRLFLLSGTEVDVTFTSPDA